MEVATPTFHSSTTFRGREAVMLGGVMSQSSREQFVEQVIEVIKSRFPLVKVARSDQSFTLLIDGLPAPLENIYRIVTLRPEDTQRQIERWIVEILRAAEGTPEESGNFEEIKDRLLPVLLADGPHDLDASSIVSQSLVEGLRVAYAIDHDRTFSYLPRQTFKSWNMELDDLHEVAISNLISRSEAINAHAAQDETGGVYLVLFQTMDGYDAARLLLPTLHERLRGYLGSPFVAAVPNRDILICFKNESAVVDRLRDQIGKDYRQMPHQVTDKLFLVTADGIAPRGGMIDPQP